MADANGTDEYVPITWSLLHMPDQLNSNVAAE